VRPPVVNCTAGSSGRPDSGEKVMVICPETSSGYGLPRLIPRTGCVAGAAVAGSPVIVAGGAGGTPTVMVSDLVALWPAPPRYRHRKRDVPGAEGVPLSEPAEFSVIPPGSVPVEPTT